MQKLSDLDKKCLSNIPMMLDVISATVSNLRVIFTPIYEDIEKCIEEFLSTSGYEIDHRNINQGVIDSLPISNEETLIPEIELSYTIPVSRTYRNKFYYFEIIWGYLADEGHNVIYYQLYDRSDYPILGDTMKSSMLGQIPKEWKTGVDIKNSIYIEFDIDDTLSVEKIRKCADDFKEYILKPFIDILNT